MTNTRRINTNFNNLFEDFFLGIPTTDTNKGYPPYNLVYIDDYHGYLEFAVAGFSQDELKVNMSQAQLTISGSAKKETETVRYIHRGIARRDFERRFTLARDTVITGAKYENGMLRVDFEIVIPEEKKPRDIPISFGNMSGPQLLQE